MRCVLLVLAFASFLIAQSVAAQSKDVVGVLPIGTDGKPLNLDFETGTLKDWIATGDAFKNQPIEGDTVFPRRADNKSQHQGKFWIGGFERHGDKPVGTLTSVPFKATHPWASFLVAGGPHDTTCVEVRRQDDDALIVRAPGLEEENLRRIVVDLKPHLGKEIFVRIVDQHTGHWGHVNFDDFRFHAEKPSFAGRPAGPAQPDVYKFAGLPPEKAAQVMTVPEGFEVKLFAGEPDVQQPIAMCLDDRGRLWVAEAYSYPIRRADKDAKDRILILEDADGDGKFDKRTVFMEGLNLVSGLEVGFGGVWIGAAPYLMFVPMADDKPSGPPQILLDGWAYQDTHETLNSFMWGPDGWLYGCHGVFTHSRVAKPGTPDKQRTPINAGVWRYHPTRHKFEVFAQGTSNPWGLDFDDWGQAFVEACVIPHCFHVIQNGRYHRQAGTHFNPYTYDDIKTIADHFHYLGATPHGGNNRSDSAGGGHAHCGLMCYLGGAWPKEYRNQLFMGNIHGRRLNVDIPRAKGSGYVAGHGKDFLFANDAWARFINLRYGPDGNVFLFDWYDKQACHHGDPKIWDRSNGRIYKVCWRDTKPVQVDLAKKSDLELVELMLNDNDWYVRHARRLLQERALAASRVPGANLFIGPVTTALEKIAFGHEDATRRLRALWALHVVGDLSFEHMTKALADKNEYIRAWTIQLAVEREGSEVITVGKLVDLAARDKSPVVRRYLASALQFLTFDVRERVLDSLVNWEEDAADHNLPLLYWYALEPLAGVPEHRRKALDIAQSAKTPLLLSYTVRRIASEGTAESLRLLVAALARSEREAAQLAILQGINLALKGQRNVAAPPEWSDAFAELVESKHNDIRSQAVALAISFGDARAFAEMRRVLLASTEDVNLRRTALDTLVAARDKELPPILGKLLADPALRGAALRSLAAYDDATTPRLILGVYSTFPANEKRDALNTLSSRKEYAKELLDAVASLVNMFKLGGSSIWS